MWRLLNGIQLTEEISPRLRARVMAFGELLSTALGIHILQLNEIDAIRVDARTLLHADIIPQSSIEDQYLQAHVQPKCDISKGNLASQNHSVVLTQGFIASTTSGSTCLLGRGGSDTSGSLFAAMLKANIFEIWTDVHGMFTSDPRHIPEARLIRNINYREAQELAAMGAKV